MRQIKSYIIFSLTALVLMVTITYGQTYDKEPHKRLSEIPERLVDSARVNPENYLHELTLELISNSSDDFEKVKIIHDWITTEISYDNEVYLRRSELIKETNDVLRNKRAICVGYCNLFRDMCTYADIECVSVTGVTKSVLENENTLPKKYPGPNHQWSAVKIKGKWYLVDITWNAGYNSVNSLNKKFTFRYSTLYFLLDPEIFIQNHFPQEAKWQLLEKPVTWSEFRTLNFTEPVNKLFLNNKTIKGGINFSRLFTLNIPYLNEAKGFNFNFSMSRGITNKLGMEAEISYDHMSISQDLNKLSPLNYNSTDGSLYIDPLSQEKIAIGRFNLNKFGVGINLKYHFVNETKLLPFLKTGFSISTPLNFRSTQSGMIAINPKGDEVVILRNFSFEDNIMYGVLISAGADLISKKNSEDTFFPVLGLELEWSFLLNSIQLFENNDQQINIKSYSINLMFYL